MRVFWITFLCLLTLPFANMAQADDRGFLTSFLEDNLSDAGRTVTVTGFTGALSSEAKIDSLTIADDEGIWLTLNHVVLDWSRAALLRGVVNVTLLTADEIIVERKPQAAADAAPTPEATGFSLPELPVSISIKKVEAKRIVLGETILGQPVEGSLAASASLEGGEGSVDLDIQRTDKGPDGHIMLKASYANASRELVLDLDVIEGEGGIAASLLDLPGAPSVELQVDGAGPLDDFAATLDLNTDAKERLRGTLWLKGQEDGAQKFNIDFQGDVAPLFLPAYAEFFGPEISLKAEATRQNTGQLDLTGLSLMARAITLEGAATIASDGLPQSFSLNGRLGLPDGAPVLLPIGGEVETRVTSADLNVGFDASQGDGWKASVALKGLDRADITLDRATIKGSGRIERQPDSGNAIVGGTLSFGADAVDLADPALAAALGRELNGTMVFDWQKGGIGLRVGRLELTEAGYTVTASARFNNFESGFRTQGSVKARYDDLSRLSGLAGRPLGGAGAFELSGQVIPLGGQFDAVGSVNGQNITVGIAELDNLLAGDSTIAFEAARSTKGTYLRKFDVTAKALSASASGKLATDGSDLMAKLLFDDLSILGDNYGGDLATDATFLGTVEQGRITLEGVGNNLKIGQQQADALTTGESRLSVAVVLRDQRLLIEKAQISNPQISADAAGYYHAKGSDISTKLTLPNLAPLGPGYRGALQADITAEGTLDAGRVNLTGRGTNLAIGNEEADRLLRGETTLSTSATFRDRKIQIENATLSNPQLSAKATGNVSEDIRQVQIEARLANLALLVPEFSGAMVVSGTAAEDGHGVTLDLKGSGPGGIDGRIAGRIAPGFRSADLSIKGSSQAALANPFLGQRSISGQTEIDLRLNGAFALSSISGQARLIGGRFSAPTLPFGLQDIEATANLAGNAAQISATASPSTGGDLRVDGRIGLGAPYTADIAVNMRDVNLKDPDLFTVDLGGDLTVSGPLTGGAVIGGAIKIREAELRVPTSGFSAVGSLPDLKHKNEPAPVHSTRYKAGLIDLGGDGNGGGTARPFGLNLAIEAPSRIFLRGRGIDAELGGRVVLRGDTNKIIPSGGFELIRGRLDILGKRLVLDQAQILLQGDLIPKLNIIATNESDGVITSVVIEGRADDPKITFRSIPDLPQEEVLARLLFGRDLQKISALQAAQLATAVASLAGKGGEGIVGRLRKGFGLDDFDVSTDDEGNLSLKAGKYISKRAYTEVEVDQKGRSKINLNLDLKKGVTVRGTVGAGGEAGLGVFIERDY